MASSALSSLLRNSAPLIRSLSPSRFAASRPLPGTSFPSTFSRPVAAARPLRPYATAAATDPGRTKGQGGGTSGRSQSGSDITVRDEGGRGRQGGLVRGNRGGGLSPFFNDFGPLFSARGDRDLFNLMEDFLAPTRLFDTILRDVAPVVQNAMPRMEITEEDKEYKIKIGLPGLKKDEVHINVEGGRKSPVLHITAHHEHNEGDNTRFWEDVDTRLRLPEGTDPDEVDAEFKDGLLTIHVPKHEDQHKTKEPKKLSIRGGDESDNKGGAIGTGSA